MSINNSFDEIPGTSLATASPGDGDAVSGVVDSFNLDPFAVHGYSPATHTHTVRPEPDRNRLYAWMTQPAVQADPTEAPEIPPPPTFGPPVKTDPFDVNGFYNEVQTIFENLHRLLEPGQVAELRAIKVSTVSYSFPHTVSGYFDHDHLQEMAATASQLSSDSKGVYVTLNVVRPDLLARHNNRVGVAKEGETTKDNEILSRRWLLIDLDPQRPSGTSATDEEKTRAWVKIHAIREFLRELSWPDPILADSGNGYHLLYSIDLPANDDGLVKRLLQALAKKFDDDFVEVDQRVFNPSRITKLYGTEVRKGDSIPLRPHRWSGIIDSPSPLIRVPKEQLEALAGAVLPKPTNTPAMTAAPIKSVGSAVERAKAYLQKLPAAVSGQDGHNKTFHAACILIHGFDLSPTDALPLLQEWNKACCPPWSEGELAHKLESAYNQTGERGYLLSKSADSPTVVGSGFEKSIMDSRQLDEADIKNEFLVRHMVVAKQLCVLGGPKKALKTSIAIDLAISISTGKPFLNKFAIPKPGKVLMCSGESGSATLRDTARRICLDKQLKLSSCDIMWADSVPRLSNLADQSALSNAIQQYKFAAVIIDPLYLALHSPESRVNHGNLYDIGPLILRAAQACVPLGATPILLHHTKTSLRGNRSFDGQPLGLEDLTYSGVGEAARQWLIVSRQKEYEPEKGVHSLWLNSGGSAGHGAIHSLVVEEGVVNSQLGGRTWKVSVLPQAKAIEEDLEKKEPEKRGSKGPQAGRGQGSNSKGSRERQVRQNHAGHLSRSRYRGKAVSVDSLGAG